MQQKVVMDLSCGFTALCSLAAKIGASWNSILRNVWPSALIHPSSRHAQCGTTEDRPAGMTVNSFTEHFCPDEDDERSEQAPASEKIDQGVTSGGKHGCY